jgi:hypothetical protein
MGISKQTAVRNTWATRGAVLISTSENMYLVIKELIRGYRWNLVAVTSNAEAALRYVYANKASVVLVDDTVDNPSIASIRAIMSDPIGCLIPVMCLLMDKHDRETAPLEKLGKIKVAPKPVTPTSFTPLYTGLIKLWETKQFAALRTIRNKVIKAPLEVQIQGYEKLKSLNQIAHLAARAKALTLLKAGHVKEAEKECLTLLKDRPSDLGLILTLGDIYMAASMPFLANKLFASANNKFDGSLITLPDMVQSSFITGQHELAIECIRKMINKEYLQEKNLAFLGRLLYSEGRMEEAAILLGNNELLFKELDNTWKGAVNSNTDPITA